MHNLVIVYIAINLNVSVLMLLYLSTVCIFYMSSIYRVQKRARALSQEFGIQSQCDLAYANLATKEYKTIASAEFLAVRSTMWKLQFGLLVVAACIGFPTTLLYEAKLRIDDDPILKILGWCPTIDWLTFYAFFLGIYKDHRPEAQANFYMTFYFIAFGLALER